MTLHTYTPQPMSLPSMNFLHLTVSEIQPGQTISLASIRVLFEEYFDPVKSELDSIRESSQIATSKFDEITDLSEKCSQLKAENLILQSKLQKAEIKCQNVEERLISLESVSRRNNLKFVLMKRGNLKTWPNKDCESVILDMCNSYNLNLQENSIERAHRLRNTQPDSPIIAKFLSYRDKLQVIRLKQKFREAGVLVTEDFPAEVIQRRRLFSSVITAAYKSKYKAHLSFDKLIVDSKVYTTNDLDKLPENLQPSNLCTVTKDGITAFYTSHSKLSNHHPCLFTVDDTTFKSVEQFYMFKKATLFNDDVTAQKILQSDDPVVANSLGKRVHNFDRDVWRKSRDHYMQTALHAKFSQNSELSDFLRNTGEAMLVEASPHDKYWGAGYSLDDDEIWDPSKWKGLNTLGKMLCDIRDNIKFS